MLYVCIWESKSRGQIDSARTNRFDIALSLTVVSDSLSAFNVLDLADSPLAPCVGYRATGVTFHVSCLEVVPSRGRHSTGIDLHSILNYTLLSDAASVCEIVVVSLLLSALAERPQGDPCERVYTPENLSA